MLAPKMLIKSSIEKIVEKIVEAKNKGLNVDIELGSILSDAQNRLTEKEFRIVIKDPRVGYKPTQAKKYIKFFRALQGQTSDLVRKLTIEKFDPISKIEDEEIQNKLIPFRRDM